MSTTKEDASWPGPPLFRASQLLNSTSAAADMNRSDLGLNPRDDPNVHHGELSAVETGRTRTCGLCQEELAHGSGNCCSGSEPHYLCDACFCSYAKAEMEPGGSFEGTRAGRSLDGGRILTSEPGRLPCYLFVTDRCDCASVPPTTIARALSTDARSLIVLDHSKRRLYAAEEEAARREAERRGREDGTLTRSAVDRLRSAVRDELSRGGYVACPECGLHGQKNDACMHMACPCGTNYCYCCGCKRGTGSPRCSGCDASSPYLESNPGWRGFSRDGETEGMGALHEFHRRRMAYFLRHMKASHPSNVWDELQRAHPDTLENVPTPGRRIDWNEIDAATPPLFGRTQEHQLQWAVQRQPFEGGYKFGDLTKSIVAKGKEKDGRDVSESYRFGDFTRGLFR